ncbi:MAG: hypothetical protein CMD58_05760, partial [Gammaproteobacteria bacterium]|nr:hypothetical protein [Gammaproteobacteria bacterium]
GTPQIIEQIKAQLGQIVPVHEVHDLWPESLRYTSGMSRFHPFFLVCRLSELLAFKKADAIIGILEHTDRYAEEILGISINKYLWVPNHCNLEDYSGINPIKKDRFTVTYTGYLGEAQYLQDLFEAVKDLPIDVCIYGDGPKKIFFEDQCRSMKINNVYFYGRTPREEIIKQQISANVLYQGWKDYSIYEYGVSSIKIPEYIASGAYVVQTANFKDHLIDSYDYGISVPLGNVDQLRKILFKLFSEKDENNSELRRIDGMKYIKNNLSLEIMSKRVNDFLNHT